MHLVVNLDYGLWDWPVFVLTLHELKLYTSISKWMMDFINKLVRLCTARLEVLIPLQRNIVENLIVALLSNTPANDIEPTAALEPKLILLLVLNSLETY